MKVLFPPAIAAILSLLMVNNVPAQTNIAQLKTTGFLGSSGLRWYSPLVLNDPLVKLSENKGSDVQPILFKYLKQNPLSKEGYIALVQADPVFREAEYKQLSANPSMERQIKFKQQVVTFYHTKAMQQSRYSAGFEQAEVYKKIVSNLRQLWKEKPEIIVGAFIVEVCSYAAMSSENDREKMINFLIGDESYKKYTVIKDNKQWNSPVPSVAMLPESKLRALSAVLNEYKATLSATSTEWLIMDGKAKKISTSSPSKENTNASGFYSRWIDTVDNGSKRQSH